MGYYTDYSIQSMGRPFTTQEELELNELEAQAETLSGALKEIVLKSISEKRSRVPKNVRQLAVTELGFYPFGDSCKWYRHDEDMKRISRKYPDTIFILEGKGEESGDIWKKYYLNGKCQKSEAVITFEEFDESKLQ